MTFDTLIPSLVAGKYRVSSELGRGGMGVVLKATHEELGTPVAIKVLAIDAALDPDALVRFQREAIAAARLRSEFIARVYDYGKLDDGRPFMVMEYLEGSDLASRQNRGLPLPRIIDAILQACAGLAEAHRAGIVHRDLKPSNLFRTTRPDGSHCTKVLDFGISKLLQDSGAAARETRTNAVLGSPLYMSPEQVRSSKSVDHRTDIWSLGVVLYELVAGAAPFQADSVVGMLAEILETQPLSLHSVRSDVPGALVGVVERCLQKDRDKRPKDVGELAALLVPFATKEGIVAAERARATIDDLAATMRKELNNDVPSEGESIQELVPAVTEEARREELPFPPALARTIPLEPAMRDAKTMVWKPARPSGAILAVLAMGAMFIVVHWAKSDRESPSATSEHSHAGSETMKSSLPSPDPTPESGAPGFSKEIVAAASSPATLAASHSARSKPHGKMPGDERLQRAGSAAPAVVAPQEGVNSPGVSPSKPTLH